MSGKVSRFCLPRLCWQINCVFLTISHEGSCFLAGVPRNSHVTLCECQILNEIPLTTLALSSHLYLLIPDHDPEDLENDRETQSSFIEETKGTSVLRDKWSGSKSRRSLGQHRTGKTVFCKSVMTIPSTSCPPSDRREVSACSCHTI